MVDKIEMSLDDIIKSSRKQKGGGGRSRGAGAGRRGTVGSAGGRGAAGGVRRGAASKSKGGRRDVPARNKPAAGGGGVLKGRNRGGGIQKAKNARGDVNSAWKHDMYDGPKRGGGLTSGAAKLLVSNLDYGVSDVDVKELFSEFGSLKKAAVHYDRSGRSLGTADVVFERRSDALKAIKQYHGVPLDGRPMDIQLATSDVSTLTKRLGTVAGGGGGNGGNTAKRRLGGAPPKRGNTGGGAGGAARRGGGGAQRGKPGSAGVGGRRSKAIAPTVEELDAELDAYVNDMKI